MKNTEKLVRVHTQRLRGEVHLRFHTENAAIFKTYDPELLGINMLFPDYQQAIEDEQTAMKRIFKSAETDRIAEADRRFSCSFASLRWQLQSYLVHFEPDILQSAKNLDVIFRHYGNISRQPYRKQLAMSKNFIQELRHHADDVNRLGLTVWINHLDDAAHRLYMLLDERAGEKSGRTSLRTVDVRRRVDALYQRMLDCMDAAIVLKGRGYVPEFAAAYNEHAAEYKYALAHHLGWVRKPVQQAAPAS